MWSAVFFGVRVNFIENVEEVRFIQKRHFMSNPNLQINPNPKNTCRKSLIRKALKISYQSYNQPCWLVMLGAPDLTNY